VRHDDPRIVQARERLRELAEQLARDPKVRARLENMAANSTSERRRAWARRGRIVEDATLREAVERAAEKLAAVNRAEGVRFRWDRLKKAEQAELDRLLAKGRNGR
jgi:hypothetical protein